MTASTFLRHGGGYFPPILMSLSVYQLTVHHDDFDSCSLSVVLSSRRPSRKGPWNGAWRLFFVLYG